MSGFFEIGIYYPKFNQNVGTLWRSAYQFGASGIFTIGKRYEKQCSDTYASYRHIPLRYFVDFDDFNEARPFAATLVAIEMGGMPLKEFKHPKQAVYLLGAEDNGIPENVLARCQYVISIPAIRQPSFNVAVAGSIVMYDRVTK